MKRSRKELDLMSQSISLASAGVLLVRRGGRFCHERAEHLFSQAQGIRELLSIADDIATLEDTSVYSSDWVLKAMERKLELVR